MAMQNINLAEIYGNIDNARAQRAQQEAMRKQQEYQQYQIGRQMRDDQRSDAVRGAYSVTPEGGLDEQVTLANLYKVDPMQAMQFKAGQDKARAEAQKLQIEQNKASLEQKKSVATYLRDAATHVNDQASYENYLNEGKALGAAFVNTAPAEYNPAWIKGQMYTADKFLDQSKPDFQKVDLGGKIQVVDMNPFTNPNIGKMDFSKTQTPDSIASNALTRRGQDITIRGQNLTDARGREANSIAQAKANNPNDKLTEGMRNTAQYAARMVAAENLLKGTTEQSTSVGEKAAGLFGETAANLTRSPDRQNALQAQRDWVRAKLRKESGAAIGKDEMDNEILTYFPQIGDSADVIAQKKLARDQATEGVINASGGAYIPPAKIETGKPIIGRDSLMPTKPTKKTGGLTKNKDGSFNYGF